MIPTSSRSTRVAFYLRVSTDEQTIDNQRTEPKQVAKTKGWEIVTVYEEQASTTKVRPKFNDLLATPTRAT